MLSPRRGPTERNVRERVISSTMVLCEEGGGGGWGVVAGTRGHNSSPAGHGAKTLLEAPSTGAALPSHSPAPNLRPAPEQRLLHILLRLLRRPLLPRHLEAPERVLDLPVPRPLRLDLVLGCLEPQAAVIEARARAERGGFSRMEGEID